MTDDPGLDLGTYLRSLRGVMGLTLREVEEKTGVSNAFLSQLESGKVKRASPTILYRLAQLYGVPYETLMERAGYPVPEPPSSSPRASSQVLRRIGSITVDEERALLDYLAFLRARARRKGPRL